MSPATVTVNKKKGSLLMSPATVTAEVRKEPIPAMALHIITESDVYLVKALCVTMVL